MDNNQNSNGTADANAGNAHTEEATQEKLGQVTDETTSEKKDSEGEQGEDPKEGRPVQNDEIEVGETVMFYPYKDDEFPEEDYVAKVVSVAPNGLLELNIDGTIRKGVPYQHSEAAKESSHWSK